MRLCHGDLHLGNICVVDGRPLLFDCIEFSEDIASIDVLYDLAFLLMDLDHRGHRDFANLVLNRYLDLTGEDAGETGGLAAMPLFLALRALIRAHVTATKAEHGWGGVDRAAAFAEVRAYLGEAEAALIPSAPRLIAIGGLSGTGKSTLAAKIAPALGPPPGARWLRSDVTRKLLFGTDPETKLPPEAYAPDITERVYRDLCAGAAAALRAGYPAVIDAVALRADERRAFAAVAAAAGVPFTGLWLEAPAERLMARVCGAQRRRLRRVARDRRNAADPRSRPARLDPHRRRRRRRFRPSPPPAAPYSTDPAAGRYEAAKARATATRVASPPRGPMIDSPTGRPPTVAPGRLTCGTPVSPPCAHRQVMRPRSASVADSGWLRGGAGNGVVGRHRIVPGGRSWRMRPRASSRTRLAQARSAAGIAAPVIRLRATLN